MPCLETGTCPILCLRHDVDGVLWQPTQGKEFLNRPYKHLGEFLRTDALLSASLRFKIIINYNLHRNGSLTFNVFVYEAIHVQEILVKYMVTFSQLLNCYIE